MKKPNKEDLMKKWAPILGSMGVSKEERERIEAEIKQENRDSKIDSLIEGKEYKEKKVHEHPDYKTGSGGQLFYLDYKYVDNKTHKKTRRAGKKHKKKWEKYLNHLVFVKEIDIDIVYPSFQKYIRKNKISKIFGLEPKPIIITSNPKGQNNFNRIR